jgi:pre-mRNA-processing factor 19
VVSKNSGHLFEKRLIEKYIAAEGKCPVTKEDLTVDDLMELQSE